MNNESTQIPEIQDFISEEQQQKDGTATSQSQSLLSVAIGTDDQDIAGDAAVTSLSSPLSKHSAPAAEQAVQSDRVNLSVSSVRGVFRASRPSVKECLHVPDEELADLSLDVYNMFFLCELFSQPFFYSLAVLATKFLLYLILFIDLGYNRVLPYERNEEANTGIKVAQILLIPVAILVEEELMTSIFIAGNLQYSKEILARHPGAVTWKFYFSNVARFLDGLIFLFINTMVMFLQSTDVLGLFLNFAALMFLQTIDNIALQVCLDGYWTKSLQETAQDVVDMKFVYRHKYKYDCFQNCIVGGLYVILVGLWAKVHYG